MEMNRNFWHDLYPVSETRRRFARSSFWQIYFPVIAGALLAVGLAVAVIGFAPGGDFTQGGQLATIVLAAGLLAAGFLAWLILLACLVGLGETLAVIPALTSRMRLRVIPVARVWKRNIHFVERAAAAVFRFFKIELRYPGDGAEEGSQPDRRGEP
jgi:hypothetical protein